MKHICLNNCSEARFLKRQRGASLLEGIAYLGIAALVVLGAVSLLTGAFSSAESNRSMEEISAIRTGVKKMYMGTANSYGTTATALNLPIAQAGVFPTTLSVNTTSGAVTNSWGGVVSVTGNGSTFVIEYQQVPQEVCISMLSGTTGWTSVAAGSGGTAITNFPLAPADAQSLCTATSNTIDLTSA